MNLSSQIYNFYIIQYHFLLFFHQEFIFNIKMTNINDYPPNTHVERHYRIIVIPS